MNVSHILVVCVGNICRSPLAAAMLSRELPGVIVSSAGISALVGAAADVTVQSIAAEAELDLGSHRSQQITADLVDGADLILAMDRSIHEDLRRSWPHTSGKTFVYDHWNGRIGIEDPYRCSVDQHRATAHAIREATAEWLKRIPKKRNS